MDKGWIHGGSRSATQPRVYSYDHPMETTLQLSSLNLLRCPDDSIDIAMICVLTLQ